MFIRSERLFLRPAWPEDRADFEALGSDLRWPEANPAEPRLPRLLVTLPGSTGSRIIGIAGLCAGGAAAEEETPELACSIAPVWRGRGFGAEAARALLPLARTLGYRRIIAFPRSGDRPSLRMLEKAGFRAIARPEATGLTPLIGAQAHVIDLMPPVDCDGPEDGGFEPMRRAA
ncbi:MAG: GNAT family N-acetyltransferase [Novosphingobium sp.]